MESGKWKVKSGKLVEYATAGMDNQLFVSKYLLELPQKRTTRSIHLKRNGIMEMNNVKNGGGGAWEVVRLGDICSIIGGGTPNRSIPEYWNGNIPWVTVKDFISKRIKSTQESITEIGIKESATNIIKKGNILIPTRMALGKIAICDIDVTINQDIKALLIKDDRLVDVNYLCYFYESQASNIESQGKGATVKGITLDVLNDLQIPLPPLPVQKRIAEILDAADALRRKDQELLQKYDALAQAIFLDMFGDPVKNEKGWEVKPFGELFDARLGKMLDAKKQIGNTKYKYLGNSNVQWFRFQLEDLAEMEFDEKDLTTFELRNGDILICEGGEVGRSAIWRNEKDNIYFQKAIHRARAKSNNITSEYTVMLFWFYAKFGGLKDFVTTSTISHLTGEKLKTIPIPVPPISLQIKFDNLILSQKKLVEQMSSNLSDTLFQTLLQKAFKSEE